VHNLLRDPCRIEGGISVYRLSQNKTPKSQNKGFSKTDSCHFFSIFVHYKTPVRIEKKIIMQQNLQAPAGISEEDRKLMMAILNSRIRNLRLLEDDFIKLKEKGKRLFGTEAVPIMVSEVLRTGREKSLVGNFKLETVARGVDIWNQFGKSLASCMNGVQQGPEGLTFLYFVFYVTQKNLQVQLIAFYDIINDRVSPLLTPIITKINEGSRINIVNIGSCICGAHTRNGGKKLLKCSDCKIARYCSQDCQKKDWAEHKGPCKNAQKKENEANATALRQIGKRLRDLK